MRSSRGTKRPRRTRPFPCPQPGSQRTWTPSSWSRWSRRPSRPSWLASITWLSSREARVRSTLWWLQQTASTICVAWIQPGTPGSKKSEAREAKRHSGVHGMKGKHFFFSLIKTDKGRYIYVALWKVNSRWDKSPGCQSLPVFSTVTFLFLF